MHRTVTFPIALAAFALLLTSAPLRAGETDDKIEASFKNSYVYKTYLLDDTVTCEAKKGIVTLSGTVADESHKGLAHDTAASLPGVTRVNNKLSTRAEVAREDADLWIGRKVKMALFVHRNVNVAATSVKVSKGVVTLGGNATSLAQKELTTEYAKDVEGVKDVKNDMTVLPTPASGERTAAETVDDASITAQVKLALLLHRSTSAMKTEVTVRSGEVTLAGVARNEAEKSLVNKLVTDIHGVTAVKNLMTVKEAKGKTLGSR